MMGLRQRGRAWAGRRGRERESEGKEMGTGEWRPDREFYCRRRFGWVGSGLDGDEGVRGGERVE